jgi:dolichyl-diphosphooligosaccharide--protein glycosyltransferase|tara:strand:+ start:441 stop:2687 length:2247 start_codon:yes stop_codon:yes gene_type:complete
MQPLEYGFELAEFDPFFNYRATQFMLENGLPAYLEWHDDLSWHPYGRDVSATSQVMLHTTAATLYQIFGMGSSLYDFVIWFPAVVGSLTTVVMFAIVRTIGGTTAGLFASLFFAISPILIMRGSIGWFKSEPLGLFYGLLAVYLLLSGLKSNNGKVSVAKIVGAGILLACGIGSWGGIQFFILPIGILFLALPFLRKDNKFLILMAVIFTSVFLLATASFEKTGIAFISGLNGFFLIGCTAFLVACIVIKRVFNRSQLRISLALLGGSIISGIAIVSSGVINLPNFRYLNAANPLLITTDMLNDSVSEHATTSLDLSFYFFTILMIFAGVGAWLLFQKKVNISSKIKSEMAAFALIIGLVGVYFSSAFVRLEVFGSLSIAILASIGLSILISKILRVQKPTSTAIKISFLAGIIILLMIPMVYPEKLNWSNNNVGIPISLLHSASKFDISTNDWPDAMQWVKKNTPEDAVIASWWDYGYWISTLGERTTLADNATLIDWQIKKIAATYFSTPDNAWRILTSDTETDVSSYFVTLPLDVTDPYGHGDNVYGKNEEKLDAFKYWMDDSSSGKIYDPEIASKYPTLFDYWESELYAYPPILTGLDADYIVINLAGEKLSEENIVPMYTFRQNGGDETKIFWFLKIADLPILDYYNRGLDSFTNKFWNETLLGKLIPFTVLIYVDPDDTTNQSDTYKPGYTAIYVQDIKFPTNGDGPFQLVYVSPSFDKVGDDGPITGALIYKINKEYNPNQ